MVFCFGVTLVCILLITVFAVLFIKKKSILGEFIQASYRGSAAVLGVAFMVNIYGSSAIAPLMILATVPLYNVAAAVSYTHLLLFIILRNPGSHKKRVSSKKTLSVLHSHSYYTSSAAAGAATTTVAATVITTARIIISIPPSRSITPLPSSLSLIHI